MVYPHSLAGKPGVILEAMGRTLKNRSDTVSKLLYQVSTIIRMRTLLQVFKDQRLGLIRWSDLAHHKLTKARPIRILFCNHSHLLLYIERDQFSQKWMRLRTEGSATDCGIYKSRCD
jgi:hypothetical protein